MSRGAKQAIVGLGAMALVLVAIVILASRGADDHGLRAQVLSTRAAQSGELVDVTVSVSDDFGSVARVEVDFGDGERAPVVDKEPTACRSDFARAETFDFTHTYRGVGPVTVRATVVSGGCGAPEERVVAVRTIDIKRPK